MYPERTADKGGGVAQGGGGGGAKLKGTQKF
jgi:hypothetical protein